MSYETVTISRAKRSTAGNRLRELLERAHAIDAEEGFEEQADDADFEQKPEVADVFEEDFDTTDEERDIDEDEDAADRTLEKEERAARRAEKQKGRHYHNPLAATRPAAAPKSAIRRVLDSADDASDGPARKKRRVSVVAPGEAEGDGSEPATPGGDAIFEAPRRFAVRASTVKNKLEVDDRLREQKERTETLYASRRRPRSSIRRLTQAELIASALETEQHNLEALRTWLEEEEERKRINKVARKVVAGPRISWVSRRVDPEVKKKRKERSKDKEGKDGMEDREGKETDRGGGAGDLPGTAGQVNEGDTTRAPGARPMIEVINAPSVVPSISAKETPTISPPNGQSNEPDRPAFDPTAPYERNYLILSSIQGQSAELRAIFGPHADWTSLRRIPASKRPAQRKPTMCPFTGLPAKYRHPATKVPYATVEGYRLVEETLRHDFLWAEDRMCFLGTTLEADGPLERAEGMDDIHGWDDAARGWWTFIEPELVPEATETEPVAAEAIEEVSAAVDAAPVPAKSSKSKKKRR